MTILQEHCGLFVVERINWFDKDKYPHIHDRTPAVAGSHVEILQRYRGIEGSAWPEEVAEHSITLSAGLAPLSQKHLVKKYCDFLRSADLPSIVDCIACMKVPFGSVSFSEQEAGLQFLGFDYGSLVCETNNYSVIFNEVVYGRYPQLTTFASSLNEHCLLPSLEIVQSLQSARLDMIVKGADVESDEVCEPFAVYAAPDE